MSLRDVFAFYNDYLKPLYCEIEAKGNQLPVELLLEIHAAFDHLKRYSLHDEDEEVCCKKAISHLKRGALDVFKLKLKYFHKDLEMLDGVDLELVDSGKFLPNMLAAKHEISTIATAARQMEGKSEPDEAFSAWFDASSKIDDFYGTYLDPSKIEWARRKTFTFINKDTLRGAAIGFLTGVASSLLVYYITLPAQLPQ